MASINRRDFLKLVGTVAATGALAACGGAVEPTTGQKSTVDHEMENEIGQWEKYRQSILPNYESFVGSDWHMVESNSKYTSSKKTLENFAAIGDREEKLIRSLQLFGVQTKDGQQLSRWSTPDMVDNQGIVYASNGEAMKVNKCNRYSQQLAMLLTYNVGGSGPHISSMFNQEQTEPLIWSLPGNNDSDQNQIPIQMNASEIGDWMGSESGKRHGWSQLESDGLVQEALDRGELVYSVTEEHNALLFRLNGKIVCSQATTDKMMESEDEMRKNGVDWKMQVGGMHQVRLYAHKIVE